MVLIESLLALLTVIPSRIGFQVTHRTVELTTISSAKNKTRPVVPTINRVLLFVAVLIASLLA